ncbi:hypothetical protein [Paenibacillus lentus]|uniref:Uncharacterized protein n=1 Tax=Paenibacillus lentus TaxID=1338368 RepID=A0A3S8RWV0_9BACL|nr:hypothetical protein [Paenibacillus lentus]AZK47260.1 hypothetical protein EIM92_14740 [Paenibacillus lentus]
MNNETQIFILLSNPRTIVTKMIGLYTRARYNHASIAFDSELREVYSFGRKHPLIPVFGGFVKENIHSGVFEKATCAIYSCSVSQRTYERMRTYVRQFEENDELYSYNFLGILGIILNMELGGANSYFCSQFVSSVFQQGGVHLVNKSAALTTPADLESCSELKLVFRGRLETYRELCCYRRNNPLQQPSYVI